MKGMIARTSPDADLDDISHDVPRGDVAGASRALARYWSRYPGGTIHLVVVDPGVGTDRRALAVEADGRFLVAPDNGVLSGVLDAAHRWTSFEISNPDLLPSERSRTFHGRDVFAPAAAHLARGGALGDLGREVDDPVRLREPAPMLEADPAVGVVVQADRFGNLITNLPGSLAVEAGEVEIAGRSVPAAATYGDVGSGALVALENSDGRLEIAVRDGSAAETLEAGPGTEVRVSRPR